MTTTRTQLNTGYAILFTLTKTKEALASCNIVKRKRYANKGPLLLMEGNNLHVGSTRPPMSFKRQHKGSNCRVMLITKFKLTGQTHISPP